MEPYELVSTWFDLCSQGVAERDAVRRHLASHAVMLALQGMPLIYAHSLVGSSNDAEGFAATGNGRDLNRARIDSGDMADALADPGSRSAQIWSGIESMLARRSANQAFHPASRQFIHPSDPGMFVIERRAVSGARALVVVNLGGIDRDVMLPAGHWRGGGRERQGGQAVRVERWSSVWFDAGAIAGP